MYIIPNCFHTKNCFYCSNSSLYENYMKFSILLSFILNNYVKQIYKMKYF